MVSGHLSPFKNTHTFQTKHTDHFLTSTQALTCKCKTTNNLQIHVGCLFCIGIDVYCLPVCPEHTHMEEGPSPPVTHRLIAEQHVDVGHDLHQVLLEELADERRREVHAEHLVVLGRVLGHLEDRLRGHRQEETLKQQTTNKIIITPNWFNGFWLAATKGMRRKE